MEPQGARIESMLADVEIRFDVCPTGDAREDLIEVPFSFEALLTYSGMRSILRLELRNAIETAHVFPFGRPVHTQVDSGLGTRFA